MFQNLIRVSFNLHSFSEVFLSNSDLSIHFLCLVRVSNSITLTDVHYRFFLTGELDQLEK